MSTELIIAVGGWLVTLVGFIITFITQSKKSEQEQDKRMQELTSAQSLHMQELQASLNQAIAIIECRIETLSERVDKHNSVVERTYKLESDTKLLEEKIKVANNRIADLEKGGN